MRGASGAWIAALVAAFLLLRVSGASAAPGRNGGLPDAAPEGVPGDDHAEQNHGIASEGVIVDTSGSTRLSEHFTVAEFTASRTALERGIDNDLPIELLANARATASMLERIRSYLSDLKGSPVPILIQSGYRSEALNRAVGGSARSDHMQALAADIRAPAFGRPLDVARALEGVTDEMGIGQLINEFPDTGNGWVHVSVQAPEREINAVLTVTRAGVVPGIIG